MSIREGLAAARIALETIAEASPDPLAKTIAAKALEAVLRACARDGERREADRDRKRAERLDRARGPTDIQGRPRTSDGQVGTSDGKGAGGVGGGVGSDLDLHGEIQDLNGSSAQGGGAGGGVQPMSAGHPTDTQRRLGGPCDDGAFGMAVDAWQRGVSSVTGEPFTRTSRSATDTLARALRKHAPSERDIAEWSFDVGADYARAHFEKRTMSAFHFADWLGSGKPAPPSRPNVRDSLPRRKGAVLQHE